MSTQFINLPPGVKRVTWEYYGAANPLGPGDLIEGRVYQHHGTHFEVNWRHQEIAPIVLLADPRVEELFPEEEYGISRTEIERIRALVQRVAHTTYVYSPRYCLDARVPSYERGDYREFNLAQQMKTYRLHPEALDIHTSGYRRPIRPAIEMIGDIFWRLRLFDETPFREDLGGQTFDPQEVGRVVLRYENGIFSERPVDEAEQGQLWGGPAFLRVVRTLTVAAHAPTPWEQAADFVHRCWVRMRDTVFAMCRGVLRCLRCLRGA